MTADQREINAAMERFGGQIAVAAMVMGRDIDDMTKEIKGCEELKIRWGKSINTPPTQAETVHRPPLEVEELLELQDTAPEPSADEMAMVKGFTQEDALLKDGLQRLGLDDQEAIIAMELRNFYKTEFVSTIQILGGSMVRVCLKLQTQLGEVTSRLSEVRQGMKQQNLGPISRLALMDEEKYLLDAYIRMSDQIRRMFDTSQRAVMLQAAIRFKIKQTENNQTRPALGKPGFSPFLSNNGPPQETNDEQQPNDTRPKRKSH
jgi:hypothetical protein